MIRPLTHCPVILIGHLASVSSSQSGSIIARFYLKRSLIFPASDLGEEITLEFVPSVSEIAIKNTFAYEYLIA
jgi:hypothetical protein